MAFVSIIQKYHTPNVQTECDLCEATSNTIWKCLQCNQVLCSQCKIIHTRSTVSRDHSLHPLTIMDDPIKVIPNITPNNDPKCEKHVNESIQMFCTTCLELVCIDCVIENHQGHNFTKLAAIALEMRQGLLLQASKSKITVNQLEVSVSSLDQQKESYSKVVNELIKQRQNQAERLKSEIDTITNDLIANLRKREKQDLKEMNENRENLLSSKQIHQDFIDTDHSLLQNMDHISTIRIAMEMKKVLNIPDKCMKANLLRHPQLCVNLDEEKCLKEAIGYLDDTNIHDATDNSERAPVADATVPSSSRTNLEIVSKFVPEIMVSRICPISNTKAWIGNYLTDLMLITIDGEVERRVKTDFDVYDFDSCDCDNLFITQYNGCTVQKLQEDTTCSLVCDLSPLRTRGISVNNNNNILVVLTDQQGKGEKLVKLTPDGKKLQTITINDNPLITRPSLVEESIRERICVLDSRKAIYVMDRSGRVRFEHTGLQGTVEFAPRGVAFDQFGNIIVSDSKNLTIYILSHEGKFLKYIVKKEDGLKAPHKISLDSSGQLWIADWNHIKVIRYS